MARFEEMDEAIDGLKTEQGEERRRALLRAEGTDPEVFAEAKRLGRVFELPSTVAVNNLSELKRKARFEEIDAAIEGAPVLARKLGEPEFAGVAQDDTGSLVEAETALGALGNPKKTQSFFEALWSAIPSSKDNRAHYSAANRAAKSMLLDQQPTSDQPEQEGALRFNKHTGRLERQGDAFTLASDLAGAFGRLPQNTLAVFEAALATEAGDTRSSPYLRAQIERRKAEDTGVDVKYPYKLGGIPSGVESLPFSLFSTVAYLSASLPTGYATRSPVTAHSAGMAASFAFAYRADRGALWNELYPVANAAFRTHTGLKRDMTPEEFTVFANEPEVAAEVRKHALAEAGFEALGNLWTIRSFSKALSSTAAKTLTAEAASKYPWLIAGTKSIAGELATETPTEIAQNQAETALGIRKGPAPEWSSTADWREAFSEVFWPTLVTMGVIGGGAKVVEATGLAEKWFEKEADANRTNMVADVIGRLSQVNEAGKVLSRDPQSLQQYLAEVAEEGPVQDVWVSPNTLMQSGVDVQALAQLSPSFAEQLDDALQRNGEVRIPVAEFATALPGTGFEQAILPHLRTDPDAMTQAEAQVFMQSQAEEFQREVETVLAKVEERSAFDTSAQVVEDSILSQLKTANRFTEDVDREYAKVARAVFSSAAARMKVTPEEAYKKFALQIRAQQIAAQYDQKTGQLKTETPEFKAWFGDPNDPNILHQSAATTEAQALVDQRTPELIEEYFTRFGNVIDPDNVKQLFPAYVADPSLAAAVHEPSSQLAKAIYTEALARNKGAPVVFTAGGGGSGKTEAMSLAQDLLGGVGEGGLIYDSTLSSFESAVRRIDEALASGSEVDIVYTNREVGGAFTFAMTRPRVVPLSVLAQAHVGASNTIRQLAEHYANNPRVQIQVVNNLGEIADINLGTLADVPSYEYNEVERRLHELARGAVEAGRISQERYAALTAPAQRADGEGAAEVQGGEQGQDLEGLGEGLASFFQSSTRQPVVSSTPIADIEEFNANMPAFLRRPGWAIITGIQEKLGAFDTPANIAANAKLEAELAARGLPFKKGPGRYLNVDQGESFLVKMSEAEALDLAKRYGQQSVLTNEGYVYQNGSLTPVDHTKDTFGDEARKQDGYTEIDGKAFSLGLDFSQEIAKADRVNPALPFAVHGVKAIHYSKNERETLDGHRFGEGLTGAERERLRDADPRLRVRTAFYVSNGRGVFPEAGVGSVAHLSTLNNVYDADADALHIWSKHRDANARELAVIEAGYAGYLGRDTFDRQGTAVVFGRTDLPTAKVEDPNVVAEVPPPPKISEVQRVRRALATSARYPAGQMSRSAWGEYVKQIDPSHFETLAPFGIFEGEEVVYRDELLREVYDQAASEKAWYSALTKAVADIRKIADKAGMVAPEQAKAWLAARQKEGKFKADEIQWSGLNEWLDLQAGKVAVGDIEAFVREHGVQVEETVLVDTLSEKERQEARNKHAGEMYGRAYADLGWSAQQDIDNFIGEGPGDTKFSSYQLPGGENYRELLLTLPEIAPSIHVEQVAGNLFEAYAPDGTVLGDGSTAEIAAEIAKRRGAKDVSFRSSHFDQPNILAHVRFNERTDADGKRVLFLEELQSDWAQKGRKEGFGYAGVQQRARQLREAFNASDWAKTADEEGRDSVFILIDNWVAGVINDNLLARKLEEKGVPYDVVGRIHDMSSGTPTAPFVTETKAWVALALKRMIRYAAENGFDRVAWTTGEQQADRYDLSKQVRRIYLHNPVFDGDTGKFLRGRLTADAATGNEIINRDVAASELPEIIGKEAAEKIVNSPSRMERRTHVLEGLDLKVGGEGMKAFYDRIVPQVANDVLKKLGGGKVGEVEIVRPNAARRDEVLAEIEAEEGTPRRRTSRMMQPGFDITPALRGAAMTGLPLFQGDQGDQAPRGQISFGTDITQQPSIISLLQQADLTTFIHELGHFQLEVLASMSAQGDASAQGDMRVLLNWFGVPDLATWQGLSLEEKRPYHEQFARGFEAYTLEGKAPSIELQGAFARIRAWMLNIYKELSLRVQLTDEVRGVFDRMLATEQQIAESETQRGYAALFESADAAGMTPEEWAEYQSLGAQATEDATAELQARSVRNMRWVSNAKSRALKALQKDAVAKRKAVEAEVREEVRRQPVYAARRFLAYGELGPEVLFGKGEELTGKLDLGALKAMYGEGPAAPWRYLPTGENGLAASEGLHPDAVAEMFGLTSGDHLVRELIGAEQEASVIEGLTDQRMLERYGDLTTPEAIERAAEKAIHNEARTKFIATELNALARATGQRKVLVPAAREFADRTVARQLIRLLKPTQYAAAEARAAKAAMTALKAGNTNEAAVEKRNQLLNNLTAKAANEAAADIESGVTYLKKFDREGTRKKVDIDYLDQIDAILERFDLRTGQSLKAIDKRKSLADWIAKQEEMGLEPAIPDSLRNEAFRKHYKELTVEEFRGLIDSIRNIEHLGRLKTKLLTAVKQREFAAAVEEIVTSIEANAKGTVAERRSSDRGRLVDVSQLARNFLADHRKFASLAREMDGWQDGGVMWEYLVRGMNAAGDKEASMREAATVKLSELLKPILKTGGMGKKTYFPQIGKSFTREERIGIALNMGNEVNRERVMSGEKLGPVQLQTILDTLTPEEGDFVQAVWSFFESYRPQIAEKQRRLTGTEPEWVQPTQVFLGGKYREGGYYPIAYDPLRSSRAEADTAAEVQRQIERGLYVQAQTRRGHLKARTESTGRPLRYDLGVIVKHVDQVVHDLSWHEFLIDANRLLRNGRVDGAIREHYGPEKLATMKDALRDIAIGDMAAQGSLDHILNHLRHGATIVGLGWRVTTSLLQPLGLTQSMVRIGPQWVAKGARHWMGGAVSLENSARLIGEKSTFMRLRSKTLQREINEIRNKVKGKDSVMEASYFYLIQKMQLIADIPTWWGAYEKAMATEENEARAIALADQAVIDAQGSGQIKDLSAVQRGGAGWKLFTTFYSFFNTTYNMTAEAVGRTNFKSPASIGLMGVDLLLLYTIPAMLGTLMKVVLSGDWEDEDALLRKLLADQVSYLTGTVMLVREGGGIAQNLIDPQHAFDYTGPASLRFFASVSKLAKQVGQGEADEPFWKSLNEVFGTIFHYPAGQINATVDGITSIADGKTENPGALIVGHKD